jgi:hypothetical protein
VRVRLNHAKAKILNNLAYLEWVGLLSADAAEGGISLYVENRGACDSVIVHV